MDPDEPIVIPIDGTLDLHTFQPREVKPLLRDYVEACLAEGVYELRIIHGKGRGVLRDIVHSTLAKIPQVASFELAGLAEGSWGATLVSLKRPAPAP